MKYLRLILVGLPILVAAFAAANFSAASYFARVSPFSAMLGSEGDALVQIAQANRMTDLGDESLFSAEDEQEIAIKALAVRPLESAAMRLLGGRMAPDMSQLPSSDALLLSERISRRDSRTQALLILQAASQGDAQEALFHIDRTLTVKPALIGNMLPQLLVVVGDEGGREIVAEHSESRWFGRFLSLAILESPTPSHIAQLIYVLDRKSQDVPLESEDFGRLVGRLSRDGAYDDAVRIAGMAGLERAVLDDFSPNAANSQELYASLTWSMPDQLEGEVSLADDGRLTLSMDSSERIEALTRVTNLATGAYDLTLQADELSGAELLGEWRLECHDGNGWSLSWRSGWVAINEDEAVAHSVGLGSTCNVQRWTFLAQSGEGSRDSNMTFSFHLSKR